MTDISIDEIRVSAQPDEGAMVLRDYFRKQRDDKIRTYKSAQFWVSRRDARRDALHYGKLVRKMEGQPHG